jgi:hypothetical protein
MVLTKKIKALLLAYSSFGLVRYLVWSSPLRYGLDQTRTKPKGEHDQRKTVNVVVVCAKKERFALLRKCII